MAFGGFSKSGAAAPMAEINMIPLIDVMLVLLVIFIVTAPLLTHVVRIELPKASSHPNLTQLDHIQLGVKVGGAVYWNGEVVDRRRSPHAWLPRRSLPRSLKCICARTVPPSTKKWPKLCPPRQKRGS